MKVHHPQELVNREAVCKHYQATFVCQTQLPTKDGWTRQPFDVFYTPTPDTSKGHGHYFGMRPDYDKGTHCYITNASALQGKVIPCVVMGDVAIYSAHQHDFVAHPLDTMVAIDGGREYTRVIGWADAYVMGRMEFADTGMTITKEVVECQS